MTIEDRLRHALAARAATVEPAPDAWACIRGRIAGARRRRRMAIPALVTAGAVAAGILGVAALTGGEGAQQVVTEPPASETPAPGDGPEATATTAPASVPLPETFLAVRDHGTELVVMDTAAGNVQRTLVDVGPYREADGHDPIGSSYIDGVTLTPDGRTAYYSTGPEPAVGNIYRISTSGGEPEFIDNGAYPRVSPDGRYLAWVNGPIQAVAVRDLTAGTTHLLETGEAAEEYPGLLAWTPGSRHLAFEYRPPGPDDPGHAIRILVVDALAARRMEESRLLAAEPGRSLHLVGFRASDGLLGTIEGPPEGDGGERFSVRDPDGGAVRGTLDLPFTATAGVYDRSGRHQLFVSDDGSVHRRSGGGFTTVLRAGGVTLVAW